jgi:hypothetical protein
MNTVIRATRNAQQICKTVIPINRGLINSANIRSFSSIKQVKVPQILPIKAFDIAKIYKPNYKSIYSRSVKTVASTRPQKNIDPLTQPVQFQLVRYNEPQHISIKNVMYYSFIGCLAAGAICFLLPVIFPVALTGFVICVSIAVATLSGAIVVVMVPIITVSDWINERRNRN